MSAARGKSRGLVDGRVRELPEADAVCRDRTGREPRFISAAAAAVAAASASRAGTAQRRGARCCVRVACRGVASGSGAAAGGSSGSASITGAAARASDYRAAFASEAVRASQAARGWSGFRLDGPRTTGRQAEQQ